ncbi:AAA family ATPase [Deinococcus ficus]|uniref:AAA family ATPase n=1 Tax=Deinococcus ficus TaxID=317577 RepID=UPI0003F53F49|nr:AAA family ATPase [Deinococcus ficus]
MTSNQKPRPSRYIDLKRIAVRFRDDFKSGNIDYILLFAYNATGKTRLSMEFKNIGKKVRRGEPANIPEKRDTLYFNAFTEDLFVWDNDLLGNTNHFLRINSQSRFFAGFEQLDLDTRIRHYLSRYGKFNFDIKYDKDPVDQSKEDWKAEFFCDIDGRRYDNIKVSRGEQNLFVWCVFLAVAELALSGAEAYDWVKYIYIDDPISSLDDNNAIAVATDLAQLMLSGNDRIKVIISSHHRLFYNVICNELKRKRSRQYFLHKPDARSYYTLRSTSDTPFFHHVAMLSEINELAHMGNGKLYPHHFNTLRVLMEKTASFFGYDHFSKCLHGIDDEVLYRRAVDLLSHGKYSLFEPRSMGVDTENLFRRILNGFMTKYQFDLPEIMVDPATPVSLVEAAITNPGTPRTTLPTEQM